MPAGGEASIEESLHYTAFFSRNAPGGSAKADLPPQKKICGLEGRNLG
jgi:hypothetical protein